jgi:DNA-binding MarR family transcriptional regulator
MMRGVTLPGPSEPLPATRDGLLHELSALTLPMMWVLRQAAVRALEPLGLRPLKALVLGMVAERTRTPGELAELLDTTPPMMSGLIADLEERGLIERRPDPDDRRRVRLELTEAGADTTERIAEFWVDAGRTQLQDLSDDDLRHLIAVYRKIVGGT